MSVSQLKLGKRQKERAPQVNIAIAIAIAMGVVCMHTNVYLFDACQYHETDEKNRKPRQVQE